MSFKRLQNTTILDKHQEKPISLDKDTSRRVNGHYIVFNFFEEFTLDMNALLDMVIINLSMKLIIIIKDYNV